MLSVRHLRAATCGLIAAGASGLMGCGSSDGGRPAVHDPARPFPPRAAEPPSTVDRGHAPAGRVVRIGGHPEGIAVDARSGLLGVATGDPSQALALVDPARLVVRSAVSLPASARHVQAADGRFLVPLESRDELAIVPPNGAAPRFVRVGDEPHDAAAVGSDIVVGDEFGGTASVVRRGAVRATVPVDVQPGGVAAVSSRLAAIVSVRAYTVALLDLRTLRLGPSQSAGDGPSHVVAGSDGRLYVADTRGGAVLEYATRPRLRALARLGGLGAPYGLALDDARGRLWATDVRGGRLLAIDVRRPGRPEVAATWWTVAQPNSVAVDARSGAAFVAGARSGLLQRVDP